MGKICVLVFCVIAAFLVAESSAKPAEDLANYLARLPWRIVRTVFVPKCPPPAAPAAPAAALAYDEEAVAAFGFDEETDDSPTNATASAATNATSSGDSSKDSNKPVVLPTAPETAADASTPEAPPTDTTEGDTASTKEE